MAIETPTAPTVVHLYIGIVGAARIVLKAQSEEGNVRKVAFFDIPSIEREALIGLIKHMSAFDAQSQQNWVNVTISDFQSEGQSFVGVMVTPTKQQG